MNENNNQNSNNNNNVNKEKTSWKDIILYIIMIIIIIIIVLLLCKYCQLTKANKQHVIKVTTTTQAISETTTTELITETTTAIPTSEVVTETTTRITTKRANYNVPSTTNNTTTRITQAPTAPTTIKPTTTTTTIKKDVYTYKYKIETSETKSFYILKNGVRMNEYILVLDGNNNPVTFSNNGVGSGLTMVNSNIDLGKCPTIKFRVCNPQGLNCGTTYTAGC